jgi:hypothetical protein
MLHNLELIGTVISDKSLNIKIKEYNNKDFISNGLYKDVINNILKV